MFKGILVSVGGGRSTERDMSIEIAARALRDDELPVFTVLVPMFREPEMLPRLAQALRALDYPLGKLDIKIVLEAEDDETIEVAQTLGLEGVFEVIRVPPSQPQTKPKACNFALRFARGEYLVVYDAEDRPEPDQLRKVVETFRRSPPNTACLQCRLSYYNANENWLTRMFTLDYALWFDLVLPGPRAAQHPDPARRHLEPFQDRRAARAARLGPVQRHRGRRSRHPPHAEGLSRRRRRLDHLRGGELPHRPLDPPALALDQGLHADLPGPHPAAAAHAAHDRRHSAFSASCSSSAAPCSPASSIRSSGCSIWPGWWRSSVGVDPLFPQILLFLSLFNLLAGNGAFIFLSMIAPIRRGWLDLIPLQPHRVRLLGADLDRRLPGAVAAPAQPVLLGEDAARRVAARRCQGRAGAGGGAVTRIAPPRRSPCSRSSLMLALAAFAVRTGFMPDDAVTLWAGAIAAGDGEMPIGRIVAAYPTIPFLATTLLEFVTPAGTPTPALLAALLLGACLPAPGSFACAPAASACIAARRGDGLDRVPSGAAARGDRRAGRHVPGGVPVPVRRRALYDLRAHSAAPEVMTVALALLGLAFSHPMGAAIAVASVPFLVLRGAAGAARQFGAQCGGRAGLPDRLLRRRLRLRVVGVSRQRLELLHRADGEPRRLGSRTFRAVRRAD